MIDWWWWWSINGGLYTFLLAITSIWYSLSLKCLSNNNRTKSSIPILFFKLNCQLPKHFSVSSYKSCLFLNGEEEAADQRLEIISASKINKYLVTVDESKIATDFLSRVNDNKFLKSLGSFYVILLSAAMTPASSATKPFTWLGLIRKATNRPRNWHFPRIPKVV